jgi:hypothetical protein
MRIAALLRTPHPRGHGCRGWSLDDPNVFKAEQHVCMESAMAWLDIRDEAPRYAQKPEGLTPLVDYDHVTGRVGPKAPQKS